MGIQQKVSVVVSGRVVVGRVIAKKGSWSTVVLEDGTTAKARNGDVTPIIIEESTEMSLIETPAVEIADIVTEPTAAEIALAEDSAATVKPASRARPAHAVGEVKPDAKGKIGGTVFDLTKYFVSEVKTESGRRTIDCADQVAEQLRGMSLEAVYEAAAAARGVPVADLKAKYEHLNAGMQRMNLGNQIRGAESAKQQALAKAEKAAAKAVADAARVEAKAKVDAGKAAAKAAREEAALAAKAAKEATKAVEATA